VQQCRHHKIENVIGYLSDERELPVSLHDCG
jgi:hypothetical protein